MRDEGTLSAPRGLSAAEVEVWERVAATVTPLEPRLAPNDPAPAPPSQVASAPPARKPVAQPDPRPVPDTHPIARRAPAPGHLDAGWDKRLKRGEVQPDLTLDLHGHGLDAAYRRLMDGVGQARGMGARTILLVTGKPRGGDPADRGTRRGAIRAKVLDWLAASPHHDAIAAVRRAHVRHGGDGALYIVLRRTR